MNFVDEDCVDTRSEQEILDSIPNVFNSFLKHKKIAENIVEKAKEKSGKNNVKGGTHAKAVIESEVTVVSKTVSKFNDDSVLDENVGKITFSTAPKIDINAVENMKESDELGDDEYIEDTEDKEDIEDYDTSSEEDDFSEEDDYCESEDDELSDEELSDEELSDEDELSDDEELSDEDEITEEVSEVAVEKETVQETVQNDIQMHENKKAELDIERAQLENAKAKLELEKAVIENEKLKMEIEKSKLAMSGMKAEVEQSSKQDTDKVVSKAVVEIVEKPVEKSVTYKNSGIEYSALNVKELFNCLIKFISENNIDTKKPLDTKMLAMEFGADNIKKLVKHNYIFNTQSGLILGKIK